MSRLLISAINKAINNNHNYLIVSNILFKKEILVILYSYGFIQGLELRGKYTIIYLKQQYWKNWGINSKSIVKIDSIKASKRGTISLKKWKYNNMMLGNAYCNIISTDRGITHGQLNNNQGGIPLITIK